MDKCNFMCVTSKYVMSTLVCFHDNVQIPFITVTNIPDIAFILNQKFSILR